MTIQDTGRVGLLRLNDIAQDVLELRHAILGGNDQIGLVQVLSLVDALDTRLRHVERVVGIIAGLALLTVLALIGITIVLSLLVVK